MDGTRGATNLGNTTLIDYGIQNEESDIRIHVCPQVRRVYVYPTQYGIQAIESGQYHQVPGYQKDIEVPTSMGYLVPPLDIERCVSLELKDKTWEHMGFSANDSLKQKGDKAERLVRGMLKNGMLPLPMKGQQITDADIQKRGQDILVIEKDGIRIQVKCDFKGGEKKLGGTGNLFLQVQECNPLDIH